MGVLGQVRQTCPSTPSCSCSAACWLVRTYQPVPCQHPLAVALPARRVVLVVLLATALAVMYPVADVYGAIAPYTSATGWVYVLHSYIRFSYYQYRVADLTAYVDVHCQMLLDDATEHVPVYCQLVQVSRYIVDAPAYLYQPAVQYLRVCCNAAYTSSTAGCYVSRCCSVATASRHIASRQC